MWVHEGFTCFAEGLYVDYYKPGQGKYYTRGMRKLIMDQKPIVATRGLNEEPPGDQYYKGANILNHIRRVMNNDSNFRFMLHHLQNKFGKSPINSTDIEKEISSYSHINWQPFFDQYLYTNEIPLVQYKRNANKVAVTLTRCNADLILPLFIFTKSGPQILLLKPNETIEFTPAKKSKKYEVIDNFNYIDTEEL
jgi:aminopeptidase N